MKIYKGIISILIYLILPFAVFSQGQIQNEVRVVKPYSPTLSDANKINLLPEFNDTVRVYPDFGYKIYPKRFETQFIINEIKPGKMVGLPISKLYKSQLTLGMGNYLTPLAELTVNELRSKTTAMGLYLNHQSSTGKVKIENGKKVDSDYSDNLARIYGKKMFYRSIFEGGISGGYNSLLYYGYDPAIKDTFLLKPDIQQKIYSAGAQVRYYSANPDSFHFNYDVDLAYDLTSDRFKNTENAVDLNTTFNSRVKDAVIGGNFRLRYFQTTESIDSFSNIVINVDPFYSKQTPEWRFLIGFNSAYDLRDNGTINIYPRTEFQFNIVKDVLVPYLGISGNREVNNYRKILFENPYLKPGTRLKNTDYSLIGFVGLKGRYSSKMAFNLKGSYLRAYNLYFFINDPGDTLGNQFIAVYDNASIKELNGEVTWHPSDKIQLLFKANYYQYDLAALEKPWHRPSVELSLSAGYNIREKILVDGDVFYTGKRFAPGTATTSVPIELKGYLDANLSVEYRYTKIISFFVKLNNFTASKYQIWNQYPVQRFQFIAGFSYAL
jgi:hypothetical protein